MVQGEFVLFNQNNFAVTLSYKQLIIWSVTAVLLLAFWYLVAKTRLGRGATRLRAGSEDGGFGRASTSTAPSR